MPGKEVIAAKCVLVTSSQPSTPGAPLAITALTIASRMPSVLAQTLVSC